MHTSLELNASPPPSSQPLSSSDFLFVTPRYKFRQLQEFWARWRRPQASGVDKQSADGGKPRAPNHTTSFGGHRIDANSLEANTPRNPPTNPHIHTHTHTHIIFSLHTCKRVRIFYSSIWLRFTDANSSNNSTPDILLVYPGPVIFTGYLNSTRSWLTTPTTLRAFVEFFCRFFLRWLFRFDTHDF